MPAIVIQVKCFSVSTLQSIYQDFITQPQSSFHHTFSYRDILAIFILKAHQMYSSVTCNKKCENNLKRITAVLFFNIFF